MTFEELSNIVSWSFAPWETDYYSLRFNEPTSTSKVSELISRNIDPESETPKQSGVYIPRNNPHVAYVAVSKGVVISSNNEEGVIIESITDVPTEPITTDVPEEEV